MCFAILAYIMTIRKKGLAAVTAPFSNIIIGTLPRFVKQDRAGILFFHLNRRGASV